MLEAGRKISGIQRALLRSTYVDVHGDDLCVVTSFVSTKRMLMPPFSYHVAVLVPGTAGTVSDIGVVPGETGVVVNTLVEGEVTGERESEGRAREGKSDSGGGEHC